MEPSGNFRNEMCNNGETISEKGHKAWWSSDTKKKTGGVGFMVQCDGLRKWCDGLRKWCDGLRTHFKQNLTDEAQCNA